MKRTTISLPDDLAAALVREAARRRVPVSQVAREAIQARLGWDDEAERDLPFIGIAQSENPTTSGQSIEDFLEKYWAEDIEADAFSGSR